MIQRKEIEFKLRSAVAIAPDAIESALKAAGGDVEPPTFHSHVDVYLDDDRGSLLRQGLGLRLRRDGDSAVLCCKERGQQHGAMHVRRELELPWTRDSAPARARDLPELLGDAVEPFVLDRPLRTLVTLEVLREQRPIRRDGTVLGDFAVDRVTAHAQGRRASFFELELEVRGDAKACEQFAGQLQQRLPVEPALDDKLTHSLAELEIQPLLMMPPLLPPAGPAQFGEFLAARLQAELADLRTAEAAVRVEGGPVEVHALRVCLRRLRVLVRAFRAAWPPEDYALAELALTRQLRELADLRDGDVMAARWPSLIDPLPEALRRGRARLQDLLVQTRGAALQRVRQALRAGSHREDQARLEAMAARNAMLPEIDGLPLSAALLRLRQTAQSTRRRLRRLSAEPPYEQLHALRLSLKRLRVLSEAVAELHRPRGRARRRLRKAIARLGDRCDQHAAVERCLAMLETTAPEALGPEACALLGAVAAQQLDAMPAASAAALAAARRLDRRWLWSDFRPKRL